ncbi:MAG TPA: MerR family transcriptional regulator [Roseiflexaceae bacterium]|nr:MerR family transcriptional regulator [Roseiflexaceae bacterium]HMP42839.1 MerR family transcriptional regulator [Roseiflexaceae bacterium]
MIEQLRRLSTFSEVPRYNIKAVMQLTQVNVSTLRAWEQRYGIPQPQRSDHGHRLYSQRDIEIIKWLRECTEHGMAISQAVLLLGESLVGASEPIAGGAEENGHLEARRWHELRNELFANLRRMNIRQAHLQVNTLVTLFSTEELILRLFYPLLVEVGERWASNDLYVAEERLISNFIRQRLLALMQTHAPFARGPRAICVCVPGEHHEIGMLMFALLLEQRGWETIYLGQDVALDGFAAFAERLAPALICASISLAENLPGLLDLAQLIVAQRNNGLLLGYSGRVFDMHPDLRQRLPGIYLGNDLVDAVQRANELADVFGAERPG